MRRPALVDRFPRPFWWRPDPDSRWDGDWPVLPDDAETRYPQLAEDFVLWRTELEKPFRRLDHQAQLLQQQFWRQHVTLILGGLLTTALGAYQAAFGAGNVAVASVQAVLAGALVGVTAMVRARRAQQGYLTARLQAEQMKSEFFLFLAKVGGYAGADRADRLRERAEDIVDAEGVR